MKFRLVSLLTISLLAASARAEEGMWMPSQTPALKERLAALGFRGDPSIFADLTGFPMGAVVSLGGCSASFVSPEGLIVTNNHCVQGALQFNSRPDRNIMVDGYLARTRGEELPSGPGSRVFVTVAIEEVTDQVLGGIPADLAPIERQKQIEQRTKEVTAAHEREPGYRCTVASFYEGLKYFALTQLEIRDVRLVYSPAAGIGNFGGETDNWRWPRHTGDYSYLRAYVGADGKPADYAKGNVPYRPKHWLKVSARGASPGEVVFVAGYPGRTARLATFDATAELVNYMLPRTVRRNTEQIALLEELRAQDKETGIRVSTRIRGLNNSLTKTKGVLESMQRGVLADRQAREQKLLAWIDADPARKAKYGHVVPGLAALAAEARKTRERNMLLNEFAGGMGTALGAAETLHRLGVEAAKPDAERDAMYQERNWPRLREGLDRLQRSLDQKADRALMRYHLAAIAKLPAAERIAELDRQVGLAPGMDAAAADQAIAAFVDKMVAGSKLYDRDFRLGLFGKKPAELAATGDSLLGLIAALHPLMEENREKSRAREGAASLLKPLYAATLLEKEGALVSPDANSTLRVTYGVVSGVEARDGMFYLPQTTMRGVAAKATGKGEFNAPAAQLQAIAALRAGKATPYLDPKLGDVPVNFLSTVDTTGGNSGSPTLNGRGELVGLLFDGTYDTVASDYYYDTEKNRSIHCDTRYMLWVMENVDHAEHLLREMVIVH